MLVLCGGCCEQDGAIVKEVGAVISDFNLQVTARFVRMAVCISHSSCYVDCILQPDLARDLLPECEQQ